LWFFKNDRARSWEENQRQIITFDSVEDFWGLYNHIELASKLQPGCDYSLFKVRGALFAVGRKC
jgi:translation initiation factor 4E